MVFLNPSSDIGFLVHTIGSYVFGDPQLVGVWLIVVLFGLIAVLNIDLSMAFLLCIPLTVVLIATGFIYGFVGGLFILVSAAVLAKNFIFR